MFLDQLMFKSSVIVHNFIVSRKMPARGLYRKLSETDRARALSWEVARRFGTINRMVQRYRYSGQFKDQTRSGRPRATAEDRYVTNVFASNRFVTGPEVRSRFYAARGPGVRPFSVNTVRNRIHAGGFKTVVPAKKPKLTKRHKDARLASSRAHARWNNPQWRRVMFSDESRFFLR